MKCPKCGQYDQGFTKESMYQIVLDNDGSPVKDVEPAILHGTTLYWCGSESCDWNIGEREFQHLLNQEDNNP